jgi:two-component system, LytTR family, sensor kinase
MQPPPASTQKYVRRFLQLLALWSAVVVLFALQWYSYDVLHGHPGPFFVYLRWNMEQWYTWLLLSPLVLWLAAKRPIDPRHPQRALLLHLLASVLFAFVAVSVQSVISRLVEPASKSILNNMAFILSKDLAMGIVTYWGLTALAQTLHFYKENSNRQIRESQLERQLAQAQLKVLQMQLHPHFLFNTLHAIGTLVYEDPKSAEQMLLNLGSLLRVFLEQEAAQTISLRRELHLVDLYLSIQKIRFQDRLTVRSVIDPETLDCAIPSLLLQPLVENAVVHGIAKNPGNDEIEISSSHQRGRLVIKISNANSTLLNEVRPDGGGWGVGLSNTMQRLAQTYDGAAKLSINARAPRGVVCEISMPFAKSASELSPAEELLAL